MFLVDRNNLGKLTLNEFQQFISPYNGYRFTEEYTVQHLKTNTIDQAGKVCITTIQRLFAMLNDQDGATARSTTCGGKCWNTSTPF